MSGFQSFSYCARLVPIRQYGQVSKKIFGLFSFLFYMPLCYPRSSTLSPFLTVLCSIRQHFGLFVYPGLRSLSQPPTPYLCRVLTHLDALLAILPLP